MNRRPVKSSNAASIGWEDGRLEVEFRSGHIYEYADVPEGVYQAIVGADSVGKELAQLRGKYESRRIR